MAIGSMIKKFTIGLSVQSEGLQSQLKGANSQLSDFAKNAARMLTIPALVGTVGSLGVSAIKDFLKTGSDLELFSSRTGIAVESVSMLGGALRKFGGDTETAKSSLEGLQNSLYEASAWGAGALMDASRKYGLNVFNDNGELKDTNQLMETLAETMEKLSKPAQQELGSMLGLDNSIISLLQKGKDGYKVLIKEQSKFNVITKSDALASKAFADTLLKLKQNLEMIGRSFTRSLLPVMKQLSKSFEKVSKWIKDNEVLFSKFGLFLGDKLIPILAMAGVLIAKALAPAILAAAPLAALFLLIEDIVSYFQGKESFTGDFLKAFPELKEKLVGLKDSFFDIFNTFKVGNFMEGIEKMGTIITDKILPIFMQIGQVMLTSFIKYSPQIADTLLKIAGTFLRGLLAPLIGEKNSKAVGDFLSNLSTYLNGFAEFFVSPITSLEKKKEMENSGFLGSGIAEKWKGNKWNILKDDEIADIYDKEYSIWSGMNKAEVKKRKDERDKEGILGAIPSSQVSNAAGTAEVKKTQNITINNNQKTSVNVKTPEEAMKVVNNVNNSVDPSLTAFSAGAR